VRAGHLAGCCAARRAGAALTPGWAALALKRPGSSSAAREVQRRGARLPEPLENTRLERREPAQQRSEYSALADDEQVPSQR